MSDGGSFYPINDKVDYSTFEVLGDGCYARDKNHIYIEKLVEIMKEADYKTFQVIEGCLAKDKNGFFIREERVVESAVKEYLEIIKSTDK